MRAASCGCLACEACARFGVVRELRINELDRDVVLQREVLGEPHRPHAALAQDADQAIAPRNDVPLLHELPKLTRSALRVSAPFPGQPRISTGDPLLRRHGLRDGRGRRRGRRGPADVGVGHRAADRWAAAKRGCRRSGRCRRGWRGRRVDGRRGHVGEGHRARRRRFDRGGRARDHLRRRATTHEERHPAASDPAWPTATTPATSARGSGCPIREARPSTGARASTRRSPPRRRRGQRPR